MLFFLWNLKLFASDSKQCFMSSNDGTKINDGNKGTGY
jgi:hypothetical protein